LKVEEKCLEWLDTLHSDMMKYRRVIICNARLISSMRFSLFVTALSERNDFAYRSSNINTNKHGVRKLD
jgi:hypothetical protein